MTAVKYYYIGETPATEIGLDAQLTNDGSLFNPIFNFNSLLVKKLQSLSNTTIAQSQPYISLKSMRLNGEVLEDLNLSFFHKPLSMEDIRTGGKFSDRANMSLEELEVSSDLATGYLYYTNVRIKIKIHKPEILNNTSLLYFLFPSAPMLLEYGWNSPDEDFMGQKEKLLFSLKTYEINFDETGQIDLSIEGTAFNDTFKTLLVGDIGQEIDNGLVAGNQVDNISNLKNKIQSYESYISDIKQQGQNAQSSDYKLKKNMAEDYQSVEKVARGKVSKNFQEAKKRLNALVKEIDFSSAKKRKPIKCVRFHDVVKTLCHDSFLAFSDTFPQVSELRIIYGNFNEQTPSTHFKSVAEFPINYEKLLEKIKTYYDTGKFVPTVSNLIDDLIADFVENQEYWKSIVSSGDEYNNPDVIVNFYNNGNTVDLAIFDTKSGIPPTLPRTPDGKASADSFRDAVVGDLDIPVISVGHAQSFVKKISLSQITDPYMKATLIERMSRDRIIGPRATKIPGQALGEVPITPLTLPLQGTATLLGHPAWKPFKVFFLEAGNFVIDGLYKIKKVTHRLSVGSYETQIEFFWH